MMPTRRKKHHSSLYIQRNAEDEKVNLAHLKNLDELEICYDGDGGGGKFVCEFAFIDRKVTLRPFLILNNKIIHGDTALIDVKTWR